VFESLCKEKLAPLTLRLALGLVCVYHGFLKIMAAGGTTWSPSLPVGWQLFFAWGEFVAGVAILVGFRCRAMAAFVMALNVGALAWWQGWKVFHLPLPTLEPTLMLLTTGLALVFLGGGELTLDRRGSFTAAPARAVRKK
jgi:uncharacterized membrane protein YphA (DoxX/SURF4 family)